MRAPRTDARTVFPAALFEVIGLVALDLLRHPYPVVAACLAGRSSSEALRPPPY